MGGLCRGMAGDVSTGRNGNASVSFLREADLRKLGHIPRRGSRPPVCRSSTSECVETPRALIRDAETCLVFVSHWWLRQTIGADGHPDDASNGKCQLLCVLELWSRALAHVYGAGVVLNGDDVGSSVPPYPGQSCFGEGSEIPSWLGEGRTSSSITRRQMNPIRHAS